MIPRREDRPPDLLSALREYHQGMTALNEVLEGLFTPCAPGCETCIFHRVEGLIAAIEANGLPELEQVQRAH